MGFSLGDSDSDDLAEAVGRTSSGSVTGIARQLRIGPASIRRLCEKVLQTPLARFEIGQDLGCRTVGSVLDFLRSLLAAACVLRHILVQQGTLKSA